MPDGVLEVGTKASPVPAGIAAEILFLDRAPDTTDDGVGIYDPRQYGTGLVCVNGTVTMHGAPMSASLVRHLLESEKWAHYQPQWEELTVAAIDGRTVHLAGALQYDHPGARDGDGTLEYFRTSHDSRAT